MKKLKYFGFIIFVVFITTLSCKEKNNDDVTIQEAISIQEDALRIVIAVDSIIDARMAKGSFEYNIDSLISLKKKVETWRHNMVPIAGKLNDPTGHNHENHNHDHEHAHEHEGSASNLSAQEMKITQLGWKTAIEALRDSLK